MKKFSPAQIGPKLKRLRSDRSVASMAEEIGVTREALYRYERGQFSLLDLPFKTVLLVEAAYGTSIISDSIRVAISKRVKRLTDLGAKRLAS